jgi:hypothetical protein
VPQRQCLERQREIELRLHQPPVRFDRDCRGVDGFRGVLELLPGLETREIRRGEIAMQIRALRLQADGFFEGADSCVLVTGEERCGGVRPQCGRVARRLQLLFELQRCEPDVGRQRRSRREGGRDR